MMRGWLIRKGEGHRKRQRALCLMPEDGGNRQGKYSESEDLGGAGLLSGFFVEVSI